MVACATAQATIIHKKKNTALPKAKSTLAALIFRSVAENRRSLLRRPGVAQLQRIDIDDQRDQQDHAAHPQAHVDVELELVQAVAQNAEDQQADQGVLDAALAAEQRCAAENHRRDTVEQHVV